MAEGDAKSAAGTQSQEVRLSVVIRAGPGPAWGLQVWGRLGTLEKQTLPNNESLVLGARAQMAQKDGCGGCTSYPLGGSDRSTS